ncbi:SCO family protein [Luteolibacter pohnpeiensis]|nr:SCO family protein [Luteolibacter pohnpeiensis]
MDPQRVGIDQNIGQQLPLNLPFRDDEDGQEHPLGDYFRSDRPAIMVMGYFECPQLCTVVMNGLVESLTEIKPRVGTSFDVFFVSIDPNETAKLGAKKKHSYVKLYGKPETAHGWHFLTGSQKSISALAQAIGFRYQTIPNSTQFAHASGLTVVTPKGKISQYFYGIEFPPKELVKAIHQAGEEKEGNKVKELILLCCQYNPIHGQYGMIIWRTLQVGAAMTLLWLAFFIVRNLRGPGKEVAS